MNPLPKPKKKKAIYVKIKIKGERKQTKPYMSLYSLLLPLTSILFFGPCQNEQAKPLREREPTQPPTQQDEWGGGGKNTKRKEREEKLQAETITAE